MNTQNLSGNLKFGFKIILFSCIVMFFYTQNVWSESLHKYKGEITVVMSNTLKPYEEAYDGLVADGRFQTTLLDMQGKPELSSWIVREIRETSPKAIVAIGMLAAQTVTLNFNDIPVIFLMVLSSETSDLKSNKITGIVLDLSYSDLFRCFDYIKPNIKNIGLIINPNKSNVDLGKLEKIALAKNANLVVANVSSEKDIPSALRQLEKPMYSFLLLPDPAIVNRESFSYILETTLKFNIPLISYSESHVKVGALFSISPIYFDIGKQCTSVLEKILNGHNVSEISVAYPHEYKMTVNHKIAKNFGLEITISREIEPILVEFP